MIVMIIMRINDQNDHNHHNDHTDNEHHDSDFRWRPIAQEIRTETADPHLFVKLNGLVCWGKFTGNHRFSH